MGLRCSGEYLTNLFSMREEEGRGQRG